MKLGNLITLAATENSTAELSEFLKGGAGIVEEREPGTTLWSALSNADRTKQFIFDTFGTEQAQIDHFSGDVANALRENATAFVKGGWQDGVLPNVQNADILSFKSGAHTTPSIAMLIPLRAKAGKENELADLLRGGAELVRKTEPGTLHWFGLSFGNGEFGIVDFFDNEEAVSAHFDGKVAAALNEVAEEIIDGGSEQGVIAGIEKLDVTAFLIRG